MIASVAIEHQRNKLLGNSIGIFPKGTNTVPAATVSRAAQHIAAAGTPQKQWLVFTRGPFAGSPQV
ncbi:MAG: hypothetical protein ACI9G1_004999, partial [Pirellulaceae bacterium]